MINHRQVVDAIERANDQRPFCECGRHTTPVWRDGTVWLECASLRERHKGRLARIVAALAAPAHVRERIVDVSPVGATTALVGGS